MPFMPWQKAFGNVRRATRRMWVGGNVREPVHPQQIEGVAPRGRGRRFRNETSFEPVALAYLGTTALTLLFFVTPGSLRPYLGLVIATLGSIPLVLSNYSVLAKIGWSLPLWIPAVIMLFAESRGSAWSWIE